MSNAQVVDLPAFCAALRAERRTLESAFRHMGAQAFASLKEATKQATQHANLWNCFMEEDTEQRLLVAAWVEMIEIAVWWRG